MWAIGLTTAAFVVMLGVAITGIALMAHNIAPDYEPAVHPFIGAGASVLAACVFIALLFGGLAMVVRSLASLHDKQDNQHAIQR